MIMLGDQVFVSARRGGGCVLLSASCDWRIGVVYGVVLVVVTRCYVMTGGGRHRLAMASAAELTACTAGVCVDVCLPMQIN